MDIKKTSSLLLNFFFRRLAEMFGVAIFLSGIVLFISLLSYSPEDPNFIFPENTEIKNFFGFYGSFISDLFFQSLGLIAYLVSITLIISGINVIKFKEFFLIIENIFFSILYSLLGTLFLTYFYSKAFDLYINGNGGFIGQYLKQSFLGSIVQINEEIFYYLLILLILFFFLISINFRPTKFYLSIKKLINILLKKEKNYTNKNEIISEYIPQEEIKNIIQEDLPFIKAETTDNKIKFKLPSLDFLKNPSRREKENQIKNETNDPEFLERILLDFGVNGNIKKVSHGPVVTLNEFEPAAGSNSFNVTTGP